MVFDEEVPDTSLLSPDECCICGEPTAEIGLFGYPWCEPCSMRCFILQWASENGYPDLHYNTGKIRYASGDGLFNWLVTVLCGTDDYVWSMLLAVEQYERERAPPGRQAFAIPFKNAFFQCLTNSAFFH